MESIGYEIYIKSFFDSNNDGIGDLNGITEKLDYLEELGVNLLWITPFYDSPFDDNGYDVRDYFLVSKIYGTNEDLDNLIKKAKQKNMRIIIDLVLNHTSDEHKWFLEAKKSKTNKYRDYYIWHDGKIIDNKKIEPTNWGSFFGGSAWNYSSETDSYYMKIFSNKMPDLNWENIDVHKEIIDIINYWLDKGIDGFRLDAVSHLAKASFIDSNLYNDKYPLDWFKFSNLDKVHDYLKMLNKKAFSKKDILTIGEVGGEASVESGLKYAGIERAELNMVYNFDHNWCHKNNETDYNCLKRAFNSWQEAFKDKGFLPLNWLNHDQPRLMSHYANKNYEQESYKMLATLLYLKRGTPFIYQGEELGMTNTYFNDISEFRDVASINLYYEDLKHNTISQALALANQKTRDNARTPMQWNANLYAGFSNVTPWIKVNENYLDINVEKQLHEENSILNYYKKLIYLRSKSKYRELLIYGNYEFIETDDLYIYKRKNEKKTILVINNINGTNKTYNIRNTIKEVLLTNYDKTLIINDIIYLKPFETIVLEIEV